MRPVFFWSRLLGVYALAFTLVFSPVASQLSYAQPPSDDSHHPLDPEAAEIARQVQKEAEEIADALKQALVENADELRAQGVEVEFGSTEIEYQDGEIVRNQQISLSVNAENCPGCLEEGVLGLIKKLPGAWKDQFKSKLAEKEVLESDVWSEERMDEVKLLREKLLDQMSELYEKYTEAEVATNFIEKGKVQVSEEGIGKANVTHINHIPTVRVVLSSNQVAYVFASDDDLERKIEEDSERYNHADYENHLLKQYIPRIQIDGGGSDGLSGRHVALIREYKGKVFEKTFLKKPAFLSQAYFNQTFNARYKTPTKGDVVMGHVSGGLQFAGSLALAGLVVYFDPDAGLNWQGAIWSLAFGTVVGSFHSTYRNVVNVGPKVWRTLKASTLGFTFAMIIKTTTGSSFDLLAMAGWITLGNVFFNVFWNSMVKDDWRRIPRLMDQHRLAQGAYKVYVPFLGDLEISRGGVREQLWYTIVFMFKYFDLLGKKVEVAGSEMHLAKFLFIASWPLAFVANATFAKAMGLPFADELIGELKEFAIQKPIRAIKWLREAPLRVEQSVWKVVTNPQGQLEVLKDGVRKKLIDTVYWDNPEKRAACEALLVPARS
jgi:hypothetical protein